ncbi:MAG TPA: alpha/beta fold hydrolase [Candidatus Limnocylindria bacterium]|nr:alpha/beta fold hydrolase [Candidatus Limnocylindria bacterium]
MDVRAAMVDVMGLRTRVLEAGDATNGDPVLLIHGVGGWAENWREVMEPIAASGRRAIAVDLPGFGESERPRRASHFDPAEPFYARFVVALLDALGLRSVHLVGNSMGGAVAYMAAVTAPERLRSLTLVASGGLGTDIALFLRLATLPGAIALAKLFGRPSHGREVLRTCFFDTSRIPEALYEEAERYGFASYPEFVRALRSGVTIRGVRPALRSRWIERASRYRGPVLVVWGREDAVLPLHHLDDAKSVFPQAEVRIIERCGHLPMVERPREFLDAVLPFLARAESAVAA